MKTINKDLEFNDDDLIIRDYNYKMTKNDLDFLSSFLEKGVNTHKPCKCLVEPRCDLKNPNLKYVYYSRILRIGIVIKEILSNIQTVEFDMVRDMIDSLKSKNNNKNFISKHDLINYLVNWEYVEILSYIIQKESSNCGYNLKSCLYKYIYDMKRSSVFSKHFDSLLNGKFERDGIIIDGFCLI